MKSDIDIKDDVFDLIKGSELTEAVTGLLYKTRRPKNSEKEDIVISVLANEGSQTQEAVVNVNIYVEDIFVDGQPEEDSIRCRTLCQTAERVLHDQHFRGMWLKFSPARVFEARNIDWHIINLRLNVKLNNE